MYIMSKHLLHDRADRRHNITKYFGMGKPIIYVHEKTACRALTDTGIMLVLSNDKQVLITYYVATRSQAINVWRSAYGENKCLPQWLYNKIMNNQKKIDELKEQGITI